MIANNEFERCLERGKLKRFAPGPGLAAKELALAASDLAESRNSQANGSYKWAIVQCYYAMFHTARALLYNEGYREKSHYCLTQAMRRLFVEPGLISTKHLENLNQAKILREEADYYGDFSQTNCELFIKKAENFIVDVKKIIHVQ